jgi:chorismate synthase
MSGNSIGKNFVVTTFGESHGVAMGCVIDGCPPGIKIDEEVIQKDLDRRKPGSNKFTTKRQEDDKVEILSGVFEGMTTGTPIGLLIKNKDQKSSDYDQLKDVYRPSHADYGYIQKYGIRDHRGGGRSSARETAMRVAAGAIAKKFLLDKLNVQVFGFINQIGEYKIKKFDREFIDQNPFFCPDESLVPELEKYIDQLRDEGDSIGASISVEASNMPLGLGEPVFDKLDADLAHALMSINAVKAVEIGNGTEVVGLKGSINRDEISPEGFESNNSGGISGGISTGQNLSAKVALKPTSSILVKGNSVNKDGESTEVISRGRHDPCVGIRAVPIVEAMTSIVLIDHYLRNRAQNHDKPKEFKKIPSSKK